MTERHDRVAAPGAARPAAERSSDTHETASVEFEGGDAACWLQYVCTECGALVEGSTATPCWRCGAFHDPTA
ncbi:hypothetical protein [Humibacter ginsenosidimutans]|uniref:Rubrerythrin-like domain-containing protein n=1 Tax=Humibacter ginsenosidimutans TaxID=2599293 RepID=A0A5B8MAF4_9MICO|nr:hypothetical protein [Humibacter ginsenosidimutans]QDZ16520.1 hypothetical protein FPZ11_18780 [Humibacter ginsenosidimutans]